METDRPIIAMDPFEDPGKIKVLVSQPSSGLVDFVVVDNRIDFVMELARLEARSNFKFFTGNVGRAQINYTRELFADEAMKNNMDYLFMIDDDMIIGYNAFESLFNTMREHNADIAAPICTQRFPPYKPVMYSHTFEDHGDGSKTINNQFLVDVGGYEPNSVVEVGGIGFGVVLIKVGLLRKMRKLMPNGMFFSNTNIGEDIWFCIKAKHDGGAKIVVDTSLKVGHMCPPRVASEKDYVEVMGLQEKFKGVYGKPEDKKTEIELANANATAA